MAVYNLWINYPTLCWWLLNFSYTCFWKFFTESRSLLFCKRVSRKYKGLHDLNLKSNGTKFVEKTLHHYPGIQIRMFCVQSILGLGTASLNLAPRIIPSIFRWTVTTFLLTKFLSHYGCYLWSLLYSRIIDITFGYEILNSTNCYPYLFQDNQPFTLTLSVTT